MDFEEEKISYIVWNNFETPTSRFKTIWNMIVGSRENFFLIESPEISHKNNVMDKIIDNVFFIIFGIIL